MGARMIELSGTVGLGFIGALYGVKLEGLIDQLILARSNQHKKNLTEDGLVGTFLRRLVPGLLFAGVWTFVGYRVSNNFSALLISLLISIAVMITTIDWQIHMIPNELVVSMLIAGAVFQIFHFGYTAFFSAFLSMIIMMCIFLIPAALLGAGKIGAGDVKLAGVMGLTLGSTYIIPAVVIMSVTLALYCGMGLVFQKLTLYSKFAFAPFMMLGLVYALAQIIGI